jgi:hypothetical protein
MVRKQELLDNLAEIEIMFMKIVRPGPDTIAGSLIDPQHNLFRSMRRVP